jgi:hypothetical protein
MAHDGFLDTIGNEGVAATGKLLFFAFWWHGDTVQDVVSCYDVGVREQEEINEMAARASFLLPRARGVRRIGPVIISGECYDVGVKTVHSAEWLVASRDEARPHPSLSPRRVSVGAALGVPGGAAGRVWGGQTAGKEPFWKAETGCNGL